MASAIPIPEESPDAKTRIEALRHRLGAELPRVYCGRASLVTESYRQTESEPVVIRRAKALSHFLSNISILINDYELIVGDYVESPGVRGGFVAIDYASHWLADELDTLSTRHVDRMYVSEEDKKTLRGLLPFWKGKTLTDKAIFMLPEELRARYYELGDVIQGALPGITGAGQGMGRISVDYERVITHGLASLTRKAEELLQQMNPGDPHDLRRIHFYKAVVITHKAVIQSAARYAELARILEREEPHPRRRAELREIAEICERVPAKPARTFWEALQSFWFIQIALMNEGCGPALVPGRMDQYLLPFYRRDLEAGRLDREKAKELLQCLFIKLNTEARLSQAAMAEFAGGLGAFNLIILGGVGRDGADATNELSYLMLEADGELNKQQPESVIRVHKGMPRDFLLEACKVAKRCRGKLKFINDDVAIQKLCGLGHTVEDARDYVLIGCHEPCVPKNSHYATAGRINVAKCLELALNQGVCRLSGKQLGPRTGDPREFRSIPDVMEAFRAQVAYFTDLVAQIATAELETHAQWAPVPFESSLVEGCLQKGVDITAGGALHNAVWIGGLGLPNVGDSLAAIKKCVFDEGKISMEELLDALDSNFEGKDEIYQMLRAAPKYGNDDDYVDLLTREAVSLCCDEIQKHKVQGFRQVSAAISSLTSGIPWGRGVAASPEGRKHGEPLADGGVSPAHGRNIRGPAATYKSVAKLDHVKMLNGSVLNMRFNPDALKDERSIQKFAALLQTYFELGGYHVQFNIVSSDMLIEAQKNPEKYRDLLVRVATWTAYFVELSTEVQNDIIKRMEFCTV